MAAGDLCSLADVRLYLQTPAGETDGDPAIAAIISRASATIRSYTQRQFGLDELGVTRTFQVRPGGLVVLAPWDLRTLTNLSVVGIAYTEAAGQIQLRPVHKPLGTYDRLRIDPLLLPLDSSRWQGSTVAVTGDWGITTLPLDVVQATVETAVIWLRRDVAAFSTVLRIDEDTVERPASLPTAAMRKLDPYKRKTI